MAISIWGKRMEEFPQIVIILKEKRSAEQTLALYQRFGGSTEIYYDAYKPALDELRRHPRCYVPGYKCDSSEVIAMSHLTVSRAFNSPAVEALSARKRAIYFDACGHWRGCIYDNIPGFVVHDYEELRVQVQKLLYDTTDAEYNPFLETHIRNTIDTYLDGRAIAHFRQLPSE